LEDAAAIDGAGMLQTFHRVILPLAGPGIAAVAMFDFIRAWNEFLFALIFLQSKELFTLPLGLASFQEEYTFRWDLIMAGASIITLPVLFFFLLMQKFIVQGLLGGAVKG
jgi:ABC-type glycerol-3-phosphate transport system permease component